MKVVPIAFPFVLVLAGAGCAHETKPPQAANGATSGVAASSSSVSPATDHSGAVAMSGDLRQVCGIADTGAAPKFDFDSALLSPADRSELDQLATCMTTGPLQGKSVQLVGRADPRGEAEYNMTLGATRANAVDHYLAQLGFDGSRLTTTSRGALDAQGHDELTYALDRRVDLRLAGQ